MRIETRSSRPKTHPRALPHTIVAAIVAVRNESGRSAEVVHAILKERGIGVSLSSVKRTLARKRLLKQRSPWKRRHLSPARPAVQHPGDLVQVDTVHLVRSDGSRVYVFTLLDVWSRWAYARAYAKANTRTALCFVRRAHTLAPFAFHMLQSDHGSEFSTHFSERIRITHRHSRVRRPNDNAHLERFNRTLQEELLNRLPVDVSIINRKLPPYLKWYAEKRHHFGLQLRTPAEVLRSY
jgi:transposase InsO family protein